MLIHLNRHTGTHAGEKPFPCAVCDFNAIYKPHLTNHLKIHAATAAAAAPVQPTAAAGRPPKCSIWLDAPLTFTCMPCGHECVCDDQECADTLFK
jgi:hypothetical protein